MNLHVIILVEPEEGFDGAKNAGGRFFLALGGIPSSDKTKGPWTAGQTASVHRAVARYLNLPDDMDADTRLKHINKLLSRPGDFTLFFSYGTWDDVTLEKFREDTERLYSFLCEECGCNGMAVSMYESV